MKSKHVELFSLCSSIYIEVWCFSGPLCSCFCAYDFSSMLTVSTPIQIETRVNRISTKDKMDGILFSSVLVKLALLEHPNSKISVKLLTQY